MRPGVQVQRISQLVSELQLLHFTFILPYWESPCSPNMTMLGLENWTSTLKCGFPWYPLPPWCLFLSLHHLGTQSYPHTTPKSLARVLGAIALTANSRVPARSSPWAGEKRVQLEGGPAGPEKRRGRCDHLFNFVLILFSTCKKLDLSHFCTKDTWRVHLGMPPVSFSWKGKVKL